MVDKSSAFSIDAILASGGSRSAGGVVGNHAAVIGDGVFGSSSSSSTPVDDAWLRQLFTDVTRQLLVARSATDARRSSMTDCGKEPHIETEQSSSNISTLIKSNSLHPRGFSIVVSSWLPRRRRSIHDARTLSFGSWTLTSPEHRNSGHVEDLPHHHASDGLRDSMHSDRQERRPAGKYVFDGRRRSRSPARRDIYAASCFFHEELAIENDGGSGATWLTEFHRGLYGDSRDASPGSRLNPSGRSTTDNHNGVEKDFNAPRTDSTLLWPLAYPFNGKCHQSNPRQCEYRLQ